MAEFEQMKSVGLLFLLAQMGSGFAVTQAQPSAAPAIIRLAPEDQEHRNYGGQHTFYFLPPGKTGEDAYQSAGFFGQKLRPLLAGSPDALLELNSYRRQKTLFLVDRALTLGGVVAYGVAIPASGDLQYFSTVQKGAIGVVAAGVLATIFINRNTGNYLRQAVDNYNSGLSGQRHGTHWPRLQPTTVGVAATPQGQPLLALGWNL